MNQKQFKPEDIFDIELPPEEPAAPAPADITETRTYRILAAIGTALLVGFGIVFAVLAIWGPSTKNYHS